ncbi:MAG: glycosyltransferase family 39 protein [Anaerolineae bacterium]|nr:glycosyltransferase family 39 protein [Anaerolineae bacterium]
MLAPARRSEKLALLAIVIAYVVLAVLYATQTPPWQVPDEPAHYNYVRQLAEGVGLPVLEAPDWDLDYLGELTGSGFDPQVLADLPAVQYEDHQPPLFYLLAAPVYALSGGSLIALRLVSVVPGIGVVLCAYGIGRAASGDGSVALGTAAFVAFVPQHVAILAGAGNDSLAELVVGAGTLLALWYVNGAGRENALRVTPLHLGLVMGIGLLTKVSTLVLGPVCALALWLRWRRAESPRLADLVRAAAWFALPALALGGLWWARNVSVYGWPDVLGLARHDAVVVGQPRTADWIAANGFGGWLAEGVRVTFQSFWGQFGWMGVPMPGWVYAALLAFVLFGWAGWVPLLIMGAGHWRMNSPAIPKKSAEADSSGQSSPGYFGRYRDALLLLLALGVFGMLAFLYYNTSFVQFQGRYLYPALPAFALGLALGWRGWATLAGRRVAWRIARRTVCWLPAWIMWGLAGLSAYALWRFVIPNLASWP